MNLEINLQPESIGENLMLLPHHEAMTARIGMPTNCYALLCGARMVLVDAVFADVLPFINALIKAGKKPVALVLSHRHIVAQAEVLPEIVQEFEIPVFLHPLDAAHPQGQRWRGFQYADPTKSALLADCGIEAALFAGHTEGSILIYQNDGAIVVAGDAAMGATVLAAENGAGEMTRPPISFNVDDDQLRRNWTAFGKAATTIAPYHGLPIVDDADEVVKALRSLRRAEPTLTLGGE